MIGFGGFAKAVMAAGWTFAKTMPHNPHEWTLKKTWPVNGMGFEEAVRFIYGSGYSMRFGRTVYKCVDVNGWRYWTMNESPERTQLMNRAKNAPKPQAYDQIATQYDFLHEDETAKAENEQVGALIESFGPGKLLDIGAGTGLALELAAIAAENYVGIDPSLSMIRRAAEKHPAHSFQNLRFEEFWPAERLHLAIGLFGAPSYVDPAAVIERLPEMADHWLLMFYGDGYEPTTHVKTGVAPLWNPVEKYAAVGGKRTRLGNFVVVTK